VRCPFPACGQEHDDDLETCPTTWMPLPRPDPDDEQDEEPEAEQEREPADGNARLALRVDDRLIVTVPVDGSVVLGREEPSPVAGACRGDTNVSRRHAEVTARGPDDVVIADIGSRNGTYVNDEKIAPDTERGLRAGDVVELANNPRLVLTVVRWAETERRPTDRLS
jgi:hypothetical protein